jgi:hypothetical protein
MYLVKGHYVDNVTVQTRIIEEVLYFIKFYQWQGWRCRVQDQFLEVHVDLDDHYINLDKNFLQGTLYEQARQKVFATLTLFNNTCDSTFFRVDGVHQLEMCFYEERGEMEYMNRKDMIENIDMMENMNMMGTHVPVIDSLH